MSLEEMRRDDWHRVSMQKEALEVYWNPWLSKQNVKFKRKVDGYWLYATAEHASVAFVRAQQMLNDMENFG